MWDMVFFGYEFYYIFFAFFIYCLIGWVWESIFMSIKYKRITNRGFLSGPIIPIYGAVATFVYVILSYVPHKIWIVYLCGMAVATLTEYVVATALELIFHAQWWDYSEYKFNYKGRIWLVASLFWGGMCCLLIFILQPNVTKLISMMPREKGEILGLIMFVIFMIDLGTTLITLIELDQAVAKVNKMRTDMIEYMENTKIYEINESIKNKYRNSRYSEWQESIKNRINDTKAVHLFKEQTEKLEAKYSLSMNQLQQFLVRRLLRAFPKVRYKTGQAAFEDVKERILKMKRTIKADVEIEIPKDKE